MGEDRDAYLDRILIGGREPASVAVVDHDDRWRLRFEEFAQRVRCAMGEQALALEHIGSTAVPGLAAKPIIDMLLTVADEAAFVPALESVGLELRVREPDHLMLRTRWRDVHLHVYEPNRLEVQDYLDLRDWLRVDTADRGLYAETKRRLAQQPWRDINDYAVAKSEVIRDVLGRARVWRNGTRSLKGMADANTQRSRLGSRSTLAGERPRHRPSGRVPLADPLRDGAAGAAAAPRARCGGFARRWRGQVWPGQRVHRLSLTCLGRRATGRPETSAW